MNYIRHLQEEAALWKQRCQGASDAIAHFEVHLASTKFQGFDPDGAPRAWIATADVRAWLMTVSDALHADPAPEEETDDRPTP
jgi:hypothetical protein